MIKLYKSELGHYGFTYKTDEIFEVPDDTVLEPPGIVSIHNVKGYTPVLIPANIAKQEQLATRVAWRSNDRATQNSATSS